MKTRIARLLVLLLVLLALAPLVMGQVSTYQRLRLGGGSSGKLAEVDAQGNLLLSMAASAAAVTDPGYASFPRVRLAGGTTGNLAEVDSTGHLMVAFGTPDGASFPSIDSPTFVVDTTNHWVGLGTATPSYPLHLVSTKTTLTDNERTVSINPTITLNATGTADITGLLSLTAVDQNGFNATDTTAAARGLQGAARATGATGTVENIVGVQGQVDNTGAGTLTLGKAFTVSAGNSGGGTYTTAAGYHIGNITAGTTVYGFYGQVTSNANRWNLYMSGTAQNYLAGNLGLGTTSPTNALSLSGQSAQTAWMERHTTSNTAGNSLTVQAGGATSGATDKAGGAVVLSPGASTGTAQAYLSKMCYTSALSTGTSDNTPFLCGAEGVSKALTDASPVNILTIAAATDTGNSVRIEYQIEVIDASHNVQIEDGFVWCRLRNSNTTLGGNTCTETSVQTLQTGTLATTWAISAANPGQVTLNADSSLTPSTGYPRLRWSAQVYGHQALVVQ
jgi:hypothetical protein